MNYPSILLGDHPSTLLGDHPSVLLGDRLGAATDSLSQIGTASTSNIASVAGLAVSVNQWKAALANATNDYDAAIAREQLAKLGVTSAMLEAEESKKRLILYIVGIGGGLVILGGIALFGTRKHEH
jgi:hypothetical protein